VQKWANAIFARSGDADDPLFGIQGRSASQSFTRHPLAGKGGGIRDARRPTHAQSVSRGLRERDHAEPILAQVVRQFRGDGRVDGLLLFLDASLHSPEKIARPLFRLKSQALSRAGAAASVSASHEHERSGGCDREITLCLAVNGSGSRGGCKAGNRFSLPLSLSLSKTRSEGEVK